ELHGAFRERADPEFGSLQVDQDADRPAVAGLDIADVGDELAHLVVRRVAHVDAEDVGAGLEQLADHRAVRRSRAQCRQDLDTAQAPHFLVPGGVGATAGGRAGGLGGAALGGFDRPGTLPPGTLPPGPTVPGMPGTRCCAGCSLASVSCTVQARWSPVSTSKKPVRSKPRARQLLVPLIVNSLSREHMNAWPDHSPPRS